MTSTFDRSPTQSLYLRAGHATCSSACLGIGVEGSEGLSGRGFDRTGFLASRF